MSVDPFDTGGATRKRRPALRGTVMLDVSMGKARVRVWPKKRGKAKTAEAKKLQDRFRQASWACKYWDPRNIVSVDELRKGTPVLIRDLQIMMMYGRFANFSMSDGRMVYTVEARNDVSGALDTICPLPGALLIRTVDGWRYINPPNASGKVLLSNVDGLADWEDQPPGAIWGDIVGNLADQTDLATFLANMNATLVASIAGKLDLGLAALKASNLSDLPSAATARGNLGLGTAATHATGDFAQSANNLSDLASEPAARTNLSVYSKAEIASLLASGGAGGAKTALASPEGQLAAGMFTVVNRYVMKLVIPDQDFAISEIRFYAGHATPTCKMQPFVYACSADLGSALALLGSGPQVTGSVAGYNHLPLTTVTNVTKGSPVWIGVNATVAALEMVAQAGGFRADAANGGSTVPSNPGPALSASNANNTIYGFWGG